DAVNEIADQERDAVAGADLVDADDRGVAEPGDAAGLAQEALQVVRPGQVAAARHLEGDHAVQLEVARLVDRAERPLADRRDHRDLAEALRRPVGGRQVVQAERRAARRAGDLRPRLRVHHLDGIMAMGAVQVHGVHPGYAPQTATAGGYAATSRLVAAYP